MKLTEMGWWYSAWTATLKPSQRQAAINLLIAIPCPCGMESRFLPAQTVRSEWTDRIIQRRKGEAS